VTKSVLDGIKGVGIERKSRLMRHFKSLNGIKNASFEELKAVIPSNAAQNVYDYFHGA
jgi:excinuclease ABC subunit C